MDTESTNESPFILENPELSDWTCYVFHNVYYTPEKGKEPNWFNRKMQELCFGVKWRKI